EHFHRLGVPRLACGGRRWSALASLSTAWSITTWRRRLRQRECAVTQRLEESHVIAARCGARGIDVLLRLRRHALRAGNDNRRTHERRNPNDEKLLHGN